MQMFTTSPGVCAHESINYHGYSQPGKRPSILKAVYPGYSILVGLYGQTNRLTCSPTCSHFEMYRWPPSLRPRPHVSGYFRICNFFFPDTATVHTYPANSTANPEKNKSALQSGKKYICNESDNVWTGESGYFLIRWRKKACSVSHRTINQYGGTTWRANRAHFPPCHYLGVRRMLWRHFSAEEPWVLEWIRIPSDTCGRGNFCIRKEKVADSKISGYVWTGPYLQIRRTGPYLQIRRPRPQVSGYFWIRNFFFLDSKISPSTRSVFKSISSSTRIRWIDSREKLAWGKHMYTQQRLTLNWVCHFIPPSMSTLKFIHSFYSSSLPRGNA